MKRAFLIGIGMLLLILLFAGHDESTHERSYVGEGPDISSPHREAVKRACLEGTLAPGQGNEKLGLRAPQDYYGKFVRSAKTEVESETKVTVTIVYKAIGNLVSDGDLLILTGTCGPDGISWESGGTVAKKFPDIF